MTPQTVSKAPLPIWQPMHLGTDEMGSETHVTLAKRNMLISGEPGSSTSGALQLVVAQEPASRAPVSERAASRTRRHC
jgi:hypothetical protein